jgi:hypothetical protein
MPLPPLPTARAHSASAGGPALVLPRAARSAARGLDLELLDKCSKPRWDWSRERIIILELEAASDR